MARSNAPSEDLAQVLDADGVGTYKPNTGSRQSGAGSIYLNLEPDAPDQTITIYDTEGPQPDPKLGIDRFRVQVRVRDANRADSYDLAAQVKDALHARDDFTEGSTTYIGLMAQTDIGYLMQDEQRRVIHTINFLGWRVPQSATHRPAA